MISPAVAWPIFESATGPVRTVQHFASDAPKARIIPDVIKGDKIVAVSMSEPSAGTALTELKTTGRIEGDENVISGPQRWGSGGAHADGSIVSYHKDECRVGKARCMTG